MFRSRKINKNQWIDTKTNTVFETGLIKGRHGKKSSFLDTPDSFLGGHYGESYYLDFYDRIQHDVDDYTTSNEVIYKRHDNKLAGKKVLIVGGGPSSNDLKWQQHYDYVITSNNYYKKFPDNKPYIINFTPYMDLSDSKLLSFLDSGNFYIGFEADAFLKNHEISMIHTFWPKYRDRIILFHTRYSSAIGVSTRQAVFAILMGADEVHLCGMDLFKDKDSVRHSFEDNKGLPRWRLAGGETLQQQLVVSFWEYVKQIGATNGCRVIILARHFDYNCLGQPSIGELS
jgi:hypothetical protein